MARAVSQKATFHPWHAIYLSQIYTIVYSVVGNVKYLKRSGEITPPSELNMELQQKMLQLAANWQCFIAFDLIRLWGQYKDDLFLYLMLVIYGQCYLVFERVCLCKSACNKNGSSCRQYIIMYHRINRIHLKMYIIVHMHACMHEPRRHWFVIKVKCMFLVTSWRNCCYLYVHQAFTLILCGMTNEVFLILPFIAL